jgi:hypothetical protein
MKTYSGRCHCGAIGFEVDADFAELFRCNCSFCTRRAAVMHKVPATRFRVVKGEESLVRYGNRDFSKHFFCGTCGIQCFTRITRGTEESVALNVGCLEGVDRELPEPRLFDGANLL